MFRTTAYVPSDPDEFATVVRAAGLEVVSTQVGSYRASIVQIDVNRIWMQHGRENLARLYRAHPPAGRVGFGIPSTANPNQEFLGQEVSWTDLIAFSPQQTTSWRSLGPSEWRAMSLARDDFVSYGQTLVGRDMSPPDFMRVQRPSLPALTRLMRLHRAAADLADTAPAVVMQPEAARGLEQALLEAIFDCLINGEERISGASRRRARIMAKFEVLLDENPGTPLFMSDICAAIGVPARTLRACCAEHLGMSPQRYLHLRRMHLARRAMLVGDPATSTVTEIATRYGFWELGRFAVAYRSLFNESPSATLRSEPRQPARELAAPFPFDSAAFA